MNQYARPVATAGSTTSRAYLIEQCGMAPADIVDYRDDDFIEQSMVRNDGAFDCVLDHVGGAMLSACCQLLAVDGHLASITDAPSQADFEHLFYRNASFHAVGGNAYSLMANRIHWKKYQDILRNLAQLFDRGELRPFQVTNVGSFSVETVRRAHAMLEQSLVQGKLVMSAP